MNTNKFNKLKKIKIGDYVKLNDEAIKMLEETSRLQDESLKYNYELKELYEKTYEAAREYFAAKNNVSRLIVKLEEFDRDYNGRDIDGLVRLYEKIQKIDANIDNIKNDIIEHNKISTSGKVIEVETMTNGCAKNSNGKVAEKADRYTVVTYEKDGRDQTYGIGWLEHMKKEKEA